MFAMQKTKENRQKKKQQKEEKNADPNKPKKPASSFILFRWLTLKYLSVYLARTPGYRKSFVYLASASQIWLVIYAYYVILLMQQRDKEELNGREARN